MQILRLISALLFTGVFGAVFIATSKKIKIFLILIMLALFVFASSGCAADGDNLIIKQRANIQVGGIRNG